MSQKPVTIVETSIFARRAEQMLSADERAEIIDYLARNPLEGDEIKETGGVRKIRFAARGKGKSGGVRVIYYYLDDDMPLFALLIYGKDEQGDLKGEQTKAIRKIAASIKALRDQKRRTG